MLMFGCGAEPAQSSNPAETSETEEPSTQPAAEKSTEAKTEAATEAVTAAEKPSAQTEALAGALEEGLKAFGYSGVAYAEYGGEVILNYGTQYNSKTVYRIASVSKQFTAAAILKLCEQGKMSVDDTLDRYFPEYNGAETVKVHHLLSMRSGITDYVYAAMNGNVPSDGLSADAPAEQNRKAIESWIFENTYPAPDISYSYSNTNFFMLGEIIEQVSGMPYEDFITESLLKPLNMNSTGFQDTWSRTDLELASGYGSGEYGYYEYNAMRYACGDMMSTAEDLAIWAKEFISGENKVLSDNIVAQMTTNYEYAGYGYGMMIDDNHHAVYHIGSITPYHSILAVFPEQRLVLVLLDNRETENPDGAYRELIKTAYNALNN